MRNNFTLTFLGSVALMTSVVGHSAQAVLVNGSIVFNGNGSGTQSGGTSTLTFNSMMVAAGTFEYSGIPLGTTVSFAPLTWTGTGNTATLTSPFPFGMPQWAINSGGTTYQFNPTFLGSALMNTTLGTVSLSGGGVAFVTGAINRDPIFATFNLQGTFSSLNFTLAPFGGHFGAPEVPEGGATLLLLGLAVACLAPLRRRPLKNPWPGVAGELAKARCSGLVRLAPGLTLHPAAFYPPRDSSLL